MHITSSNIYRVQVVTNLHNPNLLHHVSNYFGVWYSGCGGRGIIPAQAVGLGGVRQGKVARAISGYHRNVTLDPRRRPMRLAGSDKPYLRRPKLPPKILVNCDVATRILPFCGDGA